MGLEDTLTENLKYFVARYRSGCMTKQHVQAVYKILWNLLKYLVAKDRSPQYDFTFYDLREATVQFLLLSLPIEQSEKSPDHKHEKDPGVLVDTFEKYLKLLKRDVSKTIFVL